MRLHSRIASKWCTLCVCLPVVSANAVRATHSRCGIVTRVLSIFSDVDADLHISVCVYIERIYVCVSAFDWFMEGQVFYCMCHILWYVAAIPARRDAKCPFRCCQWFCLVCVCVRLGECSTMRLQWCEKWRSSEVWLYSQCDDNSLSAVRKGFCIRFVVKGHLWLESLYYAVVRQVYALTWFMRYGLHMQSDKTFYKFGLSYSRSDK